MDPLEDLASFDWIALADEAESALGDEGRALVENIGRNVTESIRQPRNALEAAADSRKTESEITDLTDLELAPQREQATRASFENHLKALFRRTGEALAQKMEAQEFMAFKPGEPATRLSLQEMQERDLANLGPHPHSELFAAPVPPGYEDEARILVKISHLSPKAQAQWLGDFGEAQAQGLPEPPIPGAQER